MPKTGKRYQNTLAKINRTKLYPIEDALTLLKEFPPAKFDETVEIHLRTGLDPRHAEQQVRSSTVLPHGLGRPMRILVFTEGETVKAAQEAGADHVGSDDLIKEVEGGFIDFDVAIATREMMGKVGKLGRVLGPRGLMPNPRSGTVVNGEDIAKTVDEAKRGRVEFRIDRLANLHVSIGKLSFEQDQLRENLAAIVEAINTARPQDTKGQYIRSATLTTTMGPGIKLDVLDTLALKVV
ncbi:MAG TPA: 50S ribosomal protein L1 [Dehalococcoidia bacterium]|nr:50S ribosomal protein L1 [Dehalococcoidia bacterium]